MFANVITNVNTNVITKQYKMQVFNKKIKVMNLHKTIFYKGIEISKCYSYEKSKYFYFVMLTNKFTSLEKAKQFITKL